MELVYETEEERILLIVSVLESILGREHSADYHEFAQITHEKREDKICESFLNWLSMKRENRGIKKLISWFKETASKA